MFLFCVVQIEYCFSSSELRRGHLGCPKGARFAGGLLEGGMLRKELEK